jgi:DNA-binding LytR/AlgR family response regulator
MRKISCITIDDEPLALELLEVYIEKVDYLDLKGAFTNPFEASDFLRKNEIDLVFLDIQMPDITGIQWLKTLEKPPMIIFTTAYSQYALEGFNLDVLDYLLKPIEFERFQKAAQKAFDYYKLIQSADSQTLENQFLVVKSDYKDVHIAYDEILYIEGMQDYCRIFIKDKKSVVTRITMSKIIELLPTQSFQRIHRSYIISLQKVEKSTKNSVFINDIAIPIGKMFG